jgi:hypothetical protein
MLVPYLPFDELRNERRSLYLSRICGFGCGMKLGGFLSYIIKLVSLLSKPINDRSFHWIQKSRRKGRLNIPLKKNRLLFYS